MYADILFLTEFINDCLILLIVKEINGYKTSVKRLLSGAITGAVISTILAVFFANLPVVLNIFAGIFLCLCMIKIAFAPKIRSLTCRLFLHTYAAAFIMGGVISFIQARFSQIPATSVSAIGFLLVKTGVFVSRLITKKSENLCHVNISFNQQIISCTALIDTGNMLVCKKTNLPVSIITSETIPEGFKSKDTHTITFNSLGCTNGTLEIIYVPYICIEYKGEKKLVYNAPLGISENRLSDSYQMIISPEIINKMEI